MMPRPSLLIQSTSIRSCRIRRLQTLPSSFVAHSIHSSRDPSSSSSSSSGSSVDRLRQHPAESNPPRTMSSLSSSLSSPPNSSRSISSTIPPPADRLVTADEPNEENDTVEIIVTLPSNARNRNDDDSPPKADESSAFSIPGADKGGRKLALIFTCGGCDTRSVKQFTERAYTRGVVIVTCPNCQRQHLIADHLGYFKDNDTANSSSSSSSSNASFDLKALVTQQGGSFRTVTTDGITQVTLEDLVGREKMNELIQAAKEKGGDRQKPMNESK